MQLRWLRPLLAWVRRREGSRPELAGALKCVLRGGFWPRARLHQAGLVLSPKCLACGALEDDEIHRYWFCEAMYKALEVEQNPELAEAWAGARGRLEAGDRDVPSL
eukprot:16184-Lingulodinium_polyedra.AAC.1